MPTLPPARSGHREGRGTFRAARPSWGPSHHGYPGTRSSGAEQPSLLSPGYPGVPSSRPGASHAEVFWRCSFVQCLKSCHTFLMHVFAPAEPSCAGYSPHCCAVCSILAMPPIPGALSAMLELSAICLSHTHAVLFAPARPQTLGGYTKLTVCTLYCVVVHSRRVARQRGTRSDIGPLPPDRTRRRRHRWYDDRVEHVCYILPCTVLIRYIQGWGERSPG